MANRTSLPIITIFVASVCGLLPPSSAWADSQPSLLVYTVLDNMRPQALKTAEQKVIKDSIAIAQRNVRDAATFFHFARIPIQDPAKLLLTHDRMAKADGLLNLYLAQPQKIEERNIAKELGLICHNLAKMQIGDGTRKLILIFEDVDFLDKDKSISGAAKGYGDGWITSSRSPFEKDFIREHNGLLKDAAVFIISSRQDPLSVRRNREAFFAKLFGLAGAKLFYYGPNYTLLPAYVEKWFSSSLQPYPAAAARPVDLLQFITPDGEENVTLN